MPFLFNQTKKAEGVPGDIEGLRDQTASFLSRRLGQFEQGRPSPFLLNQVIGPTRELFQQNRGIALAQAKESAGNLTGSGFANILGEATNRSLLQEDALIAQILQQERQNFMQALLGFGTAGVGPPQTYVQTGFLNDLIAGGGQAAAAYAGAGG